MARAEDIANDLGHRPRPVLVPDACGILDLVRSPMPDRSVARVFRHARRVVEGAEAGDCAIVFASITPQEVQDHQAETIARLRRQSEVTEVFLNEFNLVADVLGFPQVAVPAVTSAPIATSIEAFLLRLRRASQTLDESDACLASAMKRANARRAPAANKKGEYKDCQVVEEVYTLCRLSRNNGCNAPVVFLTSNVADFCVADGSGNLHPDLVPDFNALGITIAHKWDQARHLLGLPVP